jgi:NSS family neurotransmitter:Na+ symporter
MGAMITYGSYFSKNQPIITTAARVTLADLTVSLLAGMAIFPAVFSFGLIPNSGPALLFHTIPAVFDSMPLGSILMEVFFILTAIAATGAMLSLIEVSVSILSERYALSRKKATVCVIIALAMFGSLAALSHSLLKDVHIFGKTFFDVFDFSSEKLFMPIGGVLTAIFVTRVWGYQAFYKELSQGHRSSSIFVIAGLFRILSWVTPLLVLIIMLQGLGVDVFGMFIFR